MFSPPPDEAAEALARDPIDPVEATERFLEDAAAETDQPGKDEILCTRRVERPERRSRSFAEFKF